MRIVVSMLRAVGEHGLLDWEHALASPSITTGLYAFGEEEDMHQNGNAGIAHQMRAVTRAVKDEATLLRFLSEKKGIMYGIDRLLYFFCGNLAERKEDSVTQNRIARLKHCVSAACAEKSPSL